MSICWRRRYWRPSSNRYNSIQQQLLSSASIGIAIHHADDIINAVQLISQADSAMYEAKKAGRLVFAFISDHMPT